MADFLSKRAQSFAKWFVAFGNPLLWSTLDKCILLLVTVLMPFSLIVASLLTVLSFYPTFSATVGSVDPGHHAKWYWLNFAGYAILFLIALPLRRRSPNNRIFLHILVQYVWICLSLATYSAGPFTSPILMGLLGIWILNCALFELRVVAYGAVTAVTLMIGLTIATQMGKLSFAPSLIIPMVDGRLETTSLLIFGSVEVLFLVAILVVTGFLFARLRERERELELLSTVDALTQVFNRRSFLQTLEVELMRALRHQRKLSLMMVDIDFFKNINDGFGHLAGDQVLIAVVGLLKDLLRRSDIVGRFGGDEFIVLLPETDLQGAQAIAERCRREIASVTILCTAERVPHVTVSIGVAAGLAVEAETVDDLIERADRALYAAKRNGRNRIESAA